jgi:hypothetical protein
MAGDTSTATVIMTETTAIATGTTTTGITTTGITATDTTAMGITVTVIMTVTIVIAAITGIEIGAGEIATIGGATTIATDGTGTMTATGVNFRHGGVDSETPSAIFLLRLIISRKLRDLYKSTQFLTSRVKTKLTLRGFHRHKANKAGIPTCKME